jgi:hypothetical protein
MIIGSFGGFAATATGAEPWACYVEEAEGTLILTDTKAILVFDEGSGEELLSAMDCGEHVCVGDMSDNGARREFLVLEIERDDAGRPMGARLTVFDVALVGDAFSEGPVQFDSIEGPFEAPLECIALNSPNLNTQE